MSISPKFKKFNLQGVGVLENEVFKYSDPLNH